MLLFTFLLIGVALSQLLGGLISWIVIKRFKQVKRILIVEMIMMSVIIAELVWEGALITYLAPLSMLAGIFLMLLLNKTIPHSHITGIERVGFLIFCAMCFHELPEGIAFGSAYILDKAVGILTAALMAIHNIPEGSIVAIPYLLKKKSMHALKALVLTQVAYCIGGFLTYIALFGLSQTAQAFAMTFAAGMMAYIVIEELGYLR